MKNLIIVVLTLLVSTNSIAFESKKNFDVFGYCLEVNSTGDGSGSKSTGDGSGSKSTGDGSGGTESTGDGSGNQEAAFYSCIVKILSK